MSIGPHGLIRSPTAGNGGGVTIDALKQWWYAISYPEDIPALSNLSVKGVRLVYANRGGLGWYIIAKDQDIKVTQEQHTRMRKLGYIEPVKPALSWTMDNFTITEYGRKMLVALRESKKCITRR